MSVSRWSVGNGDGAGVSVSGVWRAQRVPYAALRACAYDVYAPRTSNERWHGAWRMAYVWAGPAMLAWSGAASLHHGPAGHQQLLARCPPCIPIRPIPIPNCTYISILWG